MKKYFIFYLFMMITYQGYSQEVCGQDFVIVINGKVPQEISEVIIQIMDSTGKVSSINTRYTPGNLMLAAEDYEKIAQGDSIKISFSYHTDGIHDGHEKHYEIDADKIMFGDYYCLLYIYDLKIRSNRRIFCPLDDRRNYTFEYFIPAYGMVRLMKR